MSEIEILNTAAVGQKIKRMTYEIWEHNADQKELFIVGIEGAGYKLAKVLFGELEKIADLKLSLAQLKINKEDVSQSITIDIDQLKGKNVLLVDDVVNSGKTLLHALVPIVQQEAQKIEIAALVNRKHKQFPITPDIVGLEVSTTIQEHIMVKIDKKEKISVFLQ